MRWTQILFLGRGFNPQSCGYGCEYRRFWKRGKMAISSKDYDEGEDKAVCQRLHNRFVVNFSRLAWSLLLDMKIFMTYTDLNLETI